MRRTDPVDPGRSAALLASAATAAGVALLLDALRLWLPSVIFVFGRAAATPPEEMGAFAAVPFLLALAAVVLLRRLGVRVAIGGALALVGGRLAAQATAGGDPQLVTTTIAVTGGLVWLVAVAGGRFAKPHAAVGLVAGLALDAAAHTVLRSTGIGWREGPGWWLPLLLVGAVLVAGTWRAAVDEPGGVARGWLVVGPALVLHAIVAGVPSHLHAVTGWAEPAVAAVVVGGYGLAVVVARRAAGGTGAPAWLGAVLVPVGLAALLVPPPGLAGGPAVAPALAGIGHVVAPVGLGLVLARLIATRGGVGATRRALACGLGLLGFVALAFGYYASFDMVLPVPRSAFLWVAAIAVAAAAVWPGRGEGADARVAGAGRRRAVPAAALATAVIGAAALVVVAADPVDPVPGDGLPVRVATYNLQMGFDIDGRHAVDRQAAVLRAHTADVVGLQEVSRGWLINSATDVLPRLAEQAGMAYVFTPAADRVWGNAVLSRHPLRLVEEAFLPEGDAPMRRSVQAVVVDLGDGTELGVVHTHLTHRAEDADLRAAQVEIVDAVARRLAEGGRPVVVLGDLNAEPGDPEIAPLEGWLSHAWDEPPAGTSPSWDPAAHIDHILVTDDLAANDYVVGDTLASDHLPVAATLDAR